MKTIEKREPLQRTMAAAALALTVVALPSIAFAHQNSGGMMGQNQTQSNQNPSERVSQSRGGANTAGYYGPGMMRGGYGPRMMGGGYGPGMVWGGYGPGMMWGGYGPGMMWGGYGPGMMGGGYGPGMMWGYGFGPEAMAGLDLSADQRHRIDQIQEQHFQKQQQLRTNLYDDMVHMRELMASDNSDAKAVGQAYERIAGARKKLSRDRIEMSKSMKSVLTPAQRQTLSERWGSSGGLDQTGH